MLHHTRALDDVRKATGADKNIEKWYEVTHDCMTRMKLHGLLIKYNGSPQAFLKANMPPEEWNQLCPYKFESLPLNYWNNMLHHTQALDNDCKDIGVDKEDFDFFL